jgi:hypothetical protein
MDGQPDARKNAPEVQPMNFFARLQRISWTQPSVIALVLANLFPLAGVFLFHWEVFPLLFLFWLENVVIGILNVAKMLFACGGTMESLATIPGIDPESRQKFLDVTAGRLKSADPAMLNSPALQWGLKLFLIPFFCFHYGMFTFVHGVFVVALFGGGINHGAGFLNVAMVLQIIHDNHLALPFAGLAVSRVISFFQNFLWHGEFRRTNVMTQMTQPYGRVVLMHVTILIGGFLMMALKSPAAGLALLVVLKMAFDLAGHQREREKFPPRQIAD